MHFRWSFRVLFACILLACLALISGCLPGTDRSDANHPPTDQSGFPLTIVDDAKRQVVVPNRPERIISLAPSNTEILFAVGAGDRVIAVDSFSDYPPSVQELPRLGGLDDTAFEQLVALQPDLVLTIGGTAAQVSRLEELGINVAVIQPETFNEILATINLIGRLVGSDAAAQALTADLEARVRAVVGALAAVPDDQRPRVLLEIWPDPLMSVGPGSFMHDLLELAGGKNIFADSDSPWPVVSLETAIARDPQAIITMFPDAFEQLRSGDRTGWSRMSAVRSGRILLVDENVFSRPGPRLVDALEQLAAFLHPDRWPEQ